jgi:hypothetical protein
MDLYVDTTISEHTASIFRTESILFLSSFPTRMLYAFLIPPGCYIPCPSHPPWFNNSNNIWWRVQSMELLIIKFSLTSCYLTRLGPNILLSTLFSNSLNLCSSLSVKDQVCYPYKTVKIIVFYILIFTFLDSWREDKTFWTAWHQAFFEFSLRFATLTGSVLRI